MIEEYDTSIYPKVFVMIGNSGLFKCEISSFSADYVKVESWVDNENNEYINGHYGTRPSSKVSLDEKAHTVYYLIGSSQLFVSRELYVLCYFSTRIYV